MAKLKRELPAKNPIHQRFVDQGDKYLLGAEIIADAITKSGSYGTQIGKLEKEMADLQARVAASSGHEGRIARLEQDTAVLQSAVTRIAWRQVYWVSRLFMFGVDPNTGDFLRVTPFAEILIDSGYTNVKNVKALKSTRNTKAWDKLYSDLDSTYQKDTSKYSPPPDAVDLEIFYEICAADK